MLTDLACYTQAGSLSVAPKVSELVERTTIGLVTAEAALDATIQRLADRSIHPWHAPAGDLTLMHAQRMVKQLWCAATAFLDATVASSSGDDLSQEQYRVCDKLCDDATRAGLEAISTASSVAQGQRLPNTRLISAPQFSVNGVSYEGVWAVVSALIDGVMMDLAILEQNLPTQFTRLHASLINGVAPQLKSHSYLSSQWNASSAPSNRQQIVRNIQPVLDVFYKLMQQVWAPYLLGAPYVGLLKSEAILGPLNLGIDPWMLTDPTVASNRAASQADCRALAEFWHSVADPQQAVPLQRDITDACQRGLIEIVAGSTVKIAPWFPKYVVVHPVTLDGQDIPAGKHFTIYPKGASGTRTIQIRVT